MASNTGSERVALLDSIFTRLIAWSIAVCTAVVLLLGLMVTVQFNQLTENSLRRAVELDLAALAVVYQQDGKDELLRRIDSRLTFVGDQTNPPYILLVDAAGAPIAGNLAEWPSLSADRGEAGSIDLPNGEAAYARTVRLSPDLQLLAAREARWDRTLLSRLLLAFAAAGLFVILAVALGGQVTARRLSARVARINNAFRDPDETRLSALDPGRRDRDEIGELARHSMAALARMKALVIAHRETSDKIAHEIRTPLMHLDTRIQRLLDCAEEEEWITSLDAARDEIRHVIALLESLLDIAASEARRGDVTGLPPVDLSDLARSMGELYAASAEESGHDLALDIADGVTLPGDGMALSRMIANLLDNAFKYVPCGGAVTLSLRPGPILTVADDGPGVSPEDRPHIFERFRRGRDSGSGNGTGLGLALVRAIAERHGLEVLLMPGGKGATFVVRRPSP